MAFVVIAIALGSTVGTRQVTNLEAGIGQSGHAAQMLHDGGLAKPAEEHVLISSRQGTLDQTAAGQAAADIRSAMAKLPWVASTDVPLRSAKSDALLVNITMRGDPDKASDHVSPLLKTTSQIAAKYPALHIEEAGDGSINKEVNDLVGKDLGTAANVSLPVTLVILLIAFGAIVAAGAPILLALSSVGAATGLSALVSHVIPDSGTTSSVILLMGMAVGVDYSLFYVRRVRAERARGRGTHDAIDIAAETSGHSVVVSGFAVLVSMTGMFLAGDVIFASLAAGCVLVVATAVIGSLTVLPALLVVLGKAVDRPRVPFVWRWAAQVREPRVWSALLRPSLSRPGRTLAIAVLALLAISAPALTMRLHSDTIVSLPDKVATKHTMERIGAAFPGEQASSQIVVHGSTADADAIKTALTQLGHRVSSDALFHGVSTGTVQSSADNRTHVLEVDTPFDPESAQAKQGVHELRDRLVPQALESVHSAHWAVGGDTAQVIDVDKHGSDRLPWVVAFVVIMTTLMMGWVFRSVFIALATAFMNLLSTGAAFGVLTLVFQHSWAEGLLGFKSTGAVINWVPLFTFAVLFGLSMDYHVFVLNQIREAMGEGRSAREAIRVGVLRSAGTVTSAAAVMVSVFAIFASLHMIEMKELGISLSVAVLVDAIVIRGVVLPALLAVTGRWAWWPGGRSSGRPGGRTRSDDASIAPAPTRAMMAPVR